MNDKKWQVFQEKVRELNQKRNCIGVLVLSNTVYFTKEKDVK